MIPYSNMKYLQVAPKDVKELEFLLPIPDGMEVERMGAIQKVSSNLDAHWRYKNGCKIKTTLSRKAFQAIFDISCGVL